MRFIHISDTHFGKIYKNISNYAAKRLIEDRKKRFLYAVDYAINNECKFILHSGDLFDTSNPDVIDIMFIKNALKTLQNKGIDFYFIRGNHDKKDGILFGDLNNVYEFSSDEVTKYEMEDCVIHGISQKEKDLRNPAKLITKVDGKVNIALLHSNVQNPNHNNYMPTTLKELKALDFDYIALGHIHVPTELDGNIIYAGSLCPVSKKDIGARGFYDVEILNKTVAKFVEVRGITFQKKVLEIESVYDIETFLNGEDKEQVLELILEGTVHDEEYSNIKKYLEHIQKENIFTYFSYILHLKYHDIIRHPIYPILLNDLREGSFLDNHDIEYIEGYNPIDDIEHNFKSFINIIDDLFRR